MKNIIIKFMCQLINMPYDKNLKYHLTIEHNSIEFTYNRTHIFEMTCLLNKQLNDCLLCLLDYFDKKYNKAYLNTIKIAISNNTITLYKRNVNSIIYVDRRLYEQI